MTAFHVFFAKTGHPQAIQYASWHYGAEDYMLISNPLRFSRERNELA